MKGQGNFDQEIHRHQHFLTENISLNKVKFRALNLGIVFYKQKITDISIGKFHETWQP